MPKNIASIKKVEKWQFVLEHPEYHLGPNGEVWGLMNERNEKGWMQFGHISSSELYVYGGIVGETREAVFEGLRDHGMIYIHNGQECIINYYDKECEGIECPMKIGKVTRQEYIDKYL